MGIVLALVIGLVLGYLACNSMGGKVNVSDQTGRATDSQTAQDAQTNETAVYVLIDPNVLKQLDAYMYAGQIKEGNEFLRISFNQMINNSGIPNSTDLFWYKCHNGPGGISGYTNWQGYISPSDCVYVGQWD